MKKIPHIKEVLTKDEIKAFKAYKKRIKTLKKTANLKTQ